MAFQRDPANRRMFDPERGLHLEARSYWDGTEVDVMRDTELVLRINCHLDGRPMTDEERRQHPHIRCDEVVVWHVNGPSAPDFDAFVIEVLTAYQAVNGIGCYIDGKPYEALVDVRLRSKFSRNH